MKKVLFFGNCQCDVIRYTLNLPRDKYSMEYVPVHWDRVIDKELLREKVRNSDIIITQPISDGYKNLDYLNTTFVLKNRSEKCKFIIFNSCHFEFYDLDLRKSIAEYRRSGRSVREYIDEVLNNEDYKSEEELITIAEKEIEELERRTDKMRTDYPGENVVVVPITEFIKENYRDKLLFHTFSHPANCILQHVARQILEICKIEDTMDLNVDILSHTTGIPFKCVQKVLNFDINKHPVVVDHRPMKIEDYAVKRYNEVKL